MKIIRLLAALAVLAAPPAWAQDLVYSNAASRDCSNARAALADKFACIGASANLCMERTKGGGSTVGMAGCLDRELQYWDGRLNRIYQRLVAQERRAGLEADLREMQRAWITFRDNRCGYEAAQWGNGTGAGPAYTGCLMQMTGEQALYLRSMER